VEKAKKEGRKPDYKEAVEKCILVFWILAINSKLVDEICQRS
jgi:hypothetical protein